ADNYACAGGAKATLTGRVFAPNGTLPLYNATVSVPTRAPDPITEAVALDGCSGTVSGNRIASAQTGPDGSFTLTDVPTGMAVPMVIQMGKWRREVVVQTADCATTPLTDPVQTRLPKHASEGHLPQMAIATGSADP